MRQASLSVAALILAVAVSAQDTQPLQTRVLFAQDFEEAPLGDPPPPLQDNSGWAGSTVPMAVVDSGDPRHGRVLECRVAGYCQIILGQISMQQGHLYRVTLDIASRGGQNVTLILRHDTSPYTVYVTSLEVTNEEMHTVSFLGRGLKDAPSVLLMLLMNGYTTLTIDNILIEEVTGELPPGDPPVPGNLLPNSGFELLRDGWYLRGRCSFTGSDVVEGRWAARLKNYAVVSSTWLPLSLQGDYVARAQVKSLSDTAVVRLYLSNWIFPRGGSAKSEAFTVRREEGWKEVGFRWRPPPAEGKIGRVAECYFQVLCDSPAGAEVLVDACEVKADLDGAADQPYAPAAPLELAVTTDAPYNVATVGERVIATILASGAPGPTKLVICDESHVPVRSYGLTFRDRRARVALTGLPPGYWQLVTRPLGPTTGRSEAETFLAVVPPMPSLPLDQWLCGTHIPNTPPLREACWKLGMRWDRLHDTAAWTKWTYVEKERGQWTFPDLETTQHRAYGHAILGLVDLVPQWAQSPLTEDEQQQRIFLRPETFPLWEEYCRTAATHWKGAIDTWEVMNEPYGGIAPGPYVEVLKSAYRAIKAGNPGATVIGLGGCGPSDPWLLECLKLGASHYCDAISVHGYGATIWSTVTGPERLLTVVKTIREGLRAAGTPDTPIWDTECGPSVQGNFTKFRLYGGDSSPLEAARMFPKSLAAARAAGLAHVLYYSGHEKTHAGDGGAGLFLCDLNQTVRLGVVPLAVANSLLEGRRFVRQTPHPECEGLVDLTFAGRGATVRMLWRMGDPVAVPVDPRDRCLSMWGRAVATPGGRLRLTQDPVYLVRP